MENQPLAADPKPGSERVAYEPPHFTFEDRLEVVAVVCAPTPPAKANPGACPSGPISS